MKLRSFILAAVFTPAVLLANAPTTAHTLTLQGIQPGAKITEITEAIKHKTGATKVMLDEKTGKLTVEGANITEEKIASALPTGVTVKH